ncbi:MAG: hypothetical protein LUE17_10200, partial [Planctomycetaceae bacterium]|nr:hypothetical protein [Planctomycetaceae bacterium]
MRYKPEKHYPPPYPDIPTIQSAAHGLAYDAGDIPRRHEHFFFEIYLGMERPKGVISKKNWDRIFYYARQAKRNLVALMKTWPRRRRPRPRRV